MAALPTTPRLGELRENFRRGVAKILSPMTWTLGFKSRGLEATNSKPPDCTESIAMHCWFGLDD
jgi:hypothetical protein